MHLADHSRVTLFNAENTTNPMVIMPRARQLAIVNGSAVERAQMDEICDAVSRKGYLSPIWLTKKDAEKRYRDSRYSPGFFHTCWLFWPICFARPTTSVNVT